MEAKERDLLDIIKAAFLLSSDDPPFLVDAVYLHGVSKGMALSANLFDEAAAFIRQRRAKYIAFNGSDGEGMGAQNRPGAAWPGKDWYISELSARVRPEILIPADPGLHTRGEADGLVRLAQQREWKSVVVVSSAYHSVRAMSCIVASIISLGYPLDAYFHTPSSTDWQMPIKGSQGIKDTDSSREAEEEIARILKYWRFGALDGWGKQWAAPASVLFEYLEKRGRSTP